ncbi:MAG: hypothetical protein ACE5H8_13910 [Alphaproteobacteria bacterium]
MTSAEKACAIYYAAEQSQAKRIRQAGDGVVVPEPAALQRYCEDDGDA